MNVKFDAVIFDCDGVLIDSERIYNTVLARLATEMGWPMTMQQCIEQFMGLPFDICIRKVENKTGLPVSSEALELLQMRYKADSFALMQEQLKAVPGVEKTIKTLNCPLAVASSSSHEELNHTLALAGLKKYFSAHIYSVSDVTRGKPHPDVYIHAAQQLGVSIHRCAIVEDSVNGVKAGVAAGAKVFGYCDLSEPAMLSAAGAQVFKLMHELSEHLIESVA